MGICNSKPKKSTQSSQEFTTPKYTETPTPKPITTPTPNTIECKICGINPVRCHWDILKCLICEDFIICSGCFDTKKFTQQHEPYHPMFIIDYQEKDKHMFVHSRNRLKDWISMFESVEHRKIQCISCKISEITGIRYKCNECYDYNLCQKCFDNKVASESHSLKHNLIAFINAVEYTIKPERIELLSIKGRKGNFGEVKKAKWKKDNTSITVALKSIKLDNTMDESSRKSKMESFLNEKRIYEELRCLSIIKYYGYYEEKTPGDNSTHYILTEWMENGSLTEFFRKFPEKNTFRRKLQYIVDIIQGICVIHSKNIIHKDIKPDNILVSEQEQVKIGDMGIAIRIGIDEVNMLSPLIYTAPELLRREKLCDRADIFSYGLLVNYIFTEKQHRRNAENFNLSIPEDSYFFFGLVKRCINPEPEDRPSADEIYNILFEVNKHINTKLNKNTEYSSSRTEKKNELFRQVYLEYTQINPDVVI